MKRFAPALCALAALAFVVMVPRPLHSQTRRARPLITGKVDESRYSTLSGNRRPEANALNDRGPVPGDMAVDHMLLQLQRPAEQEQALRQLVDQLHDPQSPNYHHWLSAAGFGQTFGPAPEDIAAITGWLQSRGFTVNQVYPSGMLIDFSGSASQVRAGFRTEIHYLSVSGVQHVANMSDPQIPAALAPAVAGIVSLHDFSPHAMKTDRAQFTVASGGQALVPADLATIYNLNPLFSAGITGQGQTIAVIEDSDLYSTSDWDTFRTTFGLSQYTHGSLATVHPAPAGGTSNCVDPGVPSGGDDSEAALDAEWASAAAPDAAIQVASCASTRTTFGGLIALQNLINSAQPPAIVSISYGNCEAENGAADNAAFFAAYQQAAAEGISVFVSAGDEGAASCDAGLTGATHGIGVSGWASTPYNVAVGGTDFGDTNAGTTGTYWNATNTATYGSARSYIPEIPWNDSCAGTLLAGYFGFASPYGSSGFCASSAARQNQLLAVAAGSGGPSGCATGAPSTAGVVSGTCKGYDKPSWQAGVTGNPTDGVRDIPDVSLFAGDGVWGHYYVTCWSNRRAGGAPCTGNPANWAGAGGTSFGAPIMAAIQALVNQKAGGPQGNPNPAYYRLAAQSGAACDSSGGNATPSACMFYNVTQGDIDVNCSGSEDCFGAVTLASGGGHRGPGGFGGSASSANGALSTSSQSYAPAFTAAPGWNFATGIGSVNAYNLVMNWQ